MKGLIVRVAAALLILFVPSGCLFPTSDEIQTSEASKPPPAVSSPPAATPTQAPVIPNEPIPTNTEAVPSETPPAQLVQYKGPVEHIFFHPLIAFPELAFDGDSMSQGYDDWFVTVPEFLGMLDELYNRNYILIDIHSLYRIEAKNGRSIVQRQALTLPVGKKPLILSVDDINYYDYMRENGNIWRLVSDEDGTVTAWSKTPDGQEQTSRSWDLVPIVEDFVKEHPDFSWQGAKGLLAVTGYEGILGYRTNNVNDTSYDDEKRNAQLIVRKLKETGWTFASHSWGHLDVSKSSLARLKRDTARWKKEVEPLVGPTDIFVYPYGSSVKNDDPKFQYLQAQGFAVFCSVGPSPYLAFRKDAMLMDRRHIDGMALRTQRKGLAPLFGDRPLLDPVRPPR